jgi:hypothetical protein
MMLNALKAILFFWIASMSFSVFATASHAIAAGAITVQQDASAGVDSTQGLSRDTASANPGGLHNDFDLKAVNEGMALSKAQAALATTIAPSVFKAVGDLSQSRWEEGSP